MLKSVYQNGGFYVGKYETGIEDAPKTSGSESTAPTEELNTLRKQQMYGGRVLGEKSQAYHESFKQKMPIIYKIQSFILWVNRSFPTQI